MRRLALGRIMKPWVSHSGYRGIQSCCFHGPATIGLTSAAPAMRATLDVEPVVLLTRQRQQRLVERSLDGF